MLSHSDPTAVGSVISDYAAPFAFEFQGDGYEMKPASIDTMAVATQRWNAAPNASLVGLMTARFDTELRQEIHGRLSRFFDIYRLVWTDTGISGFGRRKESMSLRPQRSASSNAAC